jgi:hypothetical protein
MQFWACVNDCIPKLTIKGNNTHPWVTRKIVKLLKKGTDYLKYGGKTSQMLELIKNI